MRQQHKPDASTSPETLLASRHLHCPGCHQVWSQDTSSGWSGAAHSKASTPALAPALGSRWPAAHGHSPLPSLKYCVGNSASGTITRTEAMQEVQARGGTAQPSPCAQARCPGLPEEADGPFHSAALVVPGSVPAAAQLVRMSQRSKQTGWGLRWVPKEKQFPPPPMSSSSFSSGSRTLLWLCSSNGHSTASWKRTSEP